MYLDSFNKTGITEHCRPLYELTVFILLSAEIPLLLVFFGVVFLSSVAAYIHLYVREAYTFGIFVTLDFFQVHEV